MGKKSLEWRKISFPVDSLYKSVPSSPYLPQMCQLSMEFIFVPTVEIRRENIQISPAFFFVSVSVSISIPGAAVLNWSLLG